MNLSKILKKLNPYMFAWWGRNAIDLIMVSILVFLTIQKHTMHPHLYWVTTGFIIFGKIYETILRAVDDVKESR